MMRIFALALLMAISGYGITTPTPGGNGPLNKTHIDIPLPGPPVGGNGPFF
jgi:hypothetical protein